MMKKFSSFNNKKVADAMTLNLYWSLFLMLFLISSFFYSGKGLGEQVAKPAAFFYACFVICFYLNLVRKI
jgi:hypothetical protein